MPQTSGVGFVGRPGPEPGRDDSGGHGQYRPEEEEDHGDDRLVVVVDEIVLSAVFFPSHVVDVSQGIVVGGAESRADAAGQQNGHHLHALKSAVGSTQRRST